MDEVELMELELELRKRKRGNQGTATAAPAPAPAATPASIPGAPSEYVAPAPDGKNARTQLNPLGKAMQGVAGSIGKTYYGLKQALMGPNEQDQRLVREQQALTNEAGPIAQTAEFAGDVGQWAVPTAKVAKGVTAATSALKSTPTLAKALGYAGAGAASSAIPAAVAPVEGDTHGEILANKGVNAAQAAAAGAAMNSALAGGGKVLTQAFKPSVEAKKLLDQGIVPTLQQGADSTTGRFVGGLTSGITQPKERLGREMQGAIVKRLLPGVDAENMTPAEVSGLLKDRVTQMYRAALPDQTITITAADRDTLGAAVRGVRGVTTESRNKAQEIVQGIFPKSRNPMNLKPDMIQTYKDKLQEAIEAYADSKGPDREVFNILRKVRDRFDENIRTKGLTPDQKALLQQADDLYREAYPVRQAAKLPEVAKRNITADDVNKQLKRMNDEKFGLEEFPMQELTAPASRVLKNMAQDESRAARNLFLGGKLAGGAAIGTMVPGMAIPLSALYGASAAGQTRAGARALFGDYDAQKRLAELIRQQRPELFSAQLGAQAVGDE